MNRSHVEVADIFKAHIGDYRERYGIPDEHYKVIGDILSCRTSYLGGHIELCDNCSKQRIAYSSCCNRHCPKCQCLAKERWLEKRKQELLPVCYFHTVFTLPHELNPLILRNKRVLLTILFKSVSETLLQFGLDPRNRLGGKLGAILFLHTWDQKLLGHFHLHCLIPGGVLTVDKNQWVSCPSDYLFPDKALSQVFRGKYMSYLAQAKEQGHLIFPGKTKETGTESGFRTLENDLWSKQWVVHIEDPIDRPEYVLEYVGRYTHRVAISNNRILSLENGDVTFAYRDRKKGTMEEMTIDAVEFIRRFLLHVLPKKFMRIRHIGLLANRWKKDNLRICRNLLGVSDMPQQETNKSVEEMMLKLTGKDITLCPICGKGHFVVSQKIPRRTGVNPFFIIHAPIPNRSG